MEHDWYYSVLDLSTVHRCADGEKCIIDDIVGARDAEVMQCPRCGAPKVIED